MFYFCLINKIYCDVEVGKNLVALNQVYPDLLELERQAFSLQIKSFDITAETGNEYKTLPSKDSLDELKKQIQR